MGMRVVAIAVPKGLERELLATAGAERDTAAVATADMSLGLVTSPTHHIVVASGNEYLPLLSRNSARTFSARNPGSAVLFLWLSDTSMASECLCYRDGKELWGIRHYPRKLDEMGEYPEGFFPSLMGALPAGVEEVLQELREKQREWDARSPHLVDCLYEAPAKVFEFVTSRTPRSMFEASDSPLRTRSGHQWDSDAIVYRFSGHELAGGSRIRWCVSPEEERHILKTAESIGYTDMDGDGVYEASYHPSIPQEVELFRFYKVVRRAHDEAKEMALSEARALDPEIQIGDELGVKFAMPWPMVAFMSSMEREGYRASL